MLFTFFLGEFYAIYLGKFDVIGMGDRYIFAADRTNCSHHLCQRFLRLTMKNLLIVEDSFLDLNVFIPLFLRKGFNISITRSGVEALKIIENNHPDIILLDVILPDISGFDICQLLKTKAKTNKIPIVICSIRSSELEQFWGLRIGANAYLTKPVGRQNLVRTIDSLVA